MERNFTLQHRLSREPTAVLSWLKDFRAFAQFHPLMEKVEIRDSEHYITHENLPLPFGLKFRFAYAVAVSCDDAKAEVYYRARPQGIAMEFTFIVSTDLLSKETRVEERVKLSGFFLFLGFTARAVARSHEALFANYAKDGR